MMSKLRPRRYLLALLVFSSAPGLPAQQQQPVSTQPEEIIPVGPGYITKGYKTIVNGQVVQTTDGVVQDRSMIGNASNQAQPIPPQPTPPKPASAGDDTALVVTIIDGVVVDPETRKPVENLPPEVELIPLGLRKIQTDVINGDQVSSSKTLLPFFKVVAKGGAPAPAAAPTPPPSNQHPASMSPEGGPDFTTLIAASESPEPDTPPEAEPKEDQGGGFFDFLFGPSEEEPADGKIVLNLDGPLSNEEMAALQQTPEFQEYLRKQLNRSRNFYSSKGRGVSSRNEPPKLPTKIKVEQFNPEEWEVEGPTPPTPNMAIGKLVSVSAERQIAVCWLQTRYLRPNSPMITRNYEMETTGVLVPSGQQEGRSAGFWIAEGNPKPGDEVIVPGPNYAALVSPWQQAPLQP